MAYSLSPHAGRSCVLPEMPGFPGLYQGTRSFFVITELVQLYCSSWLHCAGLLAEVAHWLHANCILWRPQVQVLLCAERVVKCIACASVGVTCCS